MPHRTKWPSRNNKNGHNRTSLRIYDPSSYFLVVEMFPRNAGDIEEEVSSWIQLSKTRKASRLKHSQKYVWSANESIAMKAVKLAGKQNGPFVFVADRFISFDILSMHDPRDEVSYKLKRNFELLARRDQQ